MTPSRPLGGRTGPTRVNTLITCGPCGGTTSLALAAGATALAGVLVLLDGQGWAEWLFGSVMLSCLALLGRLGVSAWRSARAQRRRAEQLAATQPASVAREPSSSNGPGWPPRSRPPSGTHWPAWPPRSRGSTATTRCRRSGEYTRRLGVRRPSFADSWDSSGTPTPPTRPTRRSSPQPRSADGVP